MSPSATEIETIVRRVLSTLTLVGAQSAAGMASRLSLSDRVVSLQSLQNRLSGIQVLEIANSTVLTPAARDYCRELKVEVQRDAKAGSITSPVSSVTRPQRLLVVGSVDWLPAVAKQLCNKQSKVIDKASDDTAAIRNIADGLRAGHQAGLAIVNAPHAACWQAARDDRLRPAVVTQWAELSDVLREVPVNLLILSTKSWNVPSTCNVARRFFQHLQNHS